MRKRARRDGVGERWFSVQRQPERRLAAGCAERNALRQLLVVQLVRIGLVGVVGWWWLGGGGVGGFHKFIIDI